MQGGWDSFFDDFTSGSDIPILVKNLLFRPHMFPGFIIKHISARNFPLHFLPDLPLEKDQMNMQISFALIVM